MIIDHLETFLFPARCVHCDVDLPKAARALCDGCAEVLPWLEPRFRCPRCFLEICKCSLLRGSLSSRIAAFSHIGPAAILLHQLKFGGREEIALSFASALLLQIEKTKMPWPDLLIPVPHARWHSFLEGYHASDLIASYLSKLMRVPLAKALSRSLTSLPQRCKDSEERKTLSKGTYRWRKTIDIVGKSLLLVDDVSTTGHTFVRCAEALRSGFPLKISACSATLVEY